MFKFFQPAVSDGSSGATILTLCVHTHMALRRSADYVIVGAGSAGCVLANRLSRTGASVLLLESGGAGGETSFDRPSLLSRCECRLYPGLIQPRRFPLARQSRPPSFS